MKICIFCQSDEISEQELVDVCRSVRAVLGVTTMAVEQPLYENDTDKFFKVSSSFLERGQAIVAIVLTTGACNEGVLGEGVQQSRGA